MPGMVIKAACAVLPGCGDHLAYPDSEQNPGKHDSINDVENELFEPGKATQLSPHQSLTRHGKGRKEHSEPQKEDIEAKEQEAGSDPEDGRSSAEDTSEDTTGGQVHYRSDYVNLPSAQLPFGDCRKKRSVDVGKA